jgi:hypothetical protein
VPSDGIDVPIIPEELIECVYLGPELSAVDREEVVQACAAIDLKTPLVTSTLLGRPRYT